MSSFCFVCRYVYDPLREFELTLDSITPSKLTLVEYSYEYDAAERLIRDAADRLSIGYNKISLNQLVTAAGGSAAVFERSVKQRLQEAAAAGRWVLFWMTQPASVPRALLEHLLFNVSRWLAELGDSTANGDGGATATPKSPSGQQVGTTTATSTAAAQSSSRPEVPLSPIARELSGEDTEDTLVGDSPSQALSSSRALRCFLLMQLEPQLMPSCEFFQDTTRLVVDTSMVLVSVSVDCTTRSF